MLNVSTNQKRLHHTHKLSWKKGKSYDDFSCFSTSSSDDILLTWRNREQRKRESIFEASLFNPEKSWVVLTMIERSLAIFFRWNLFKFNSFFVSCWLINKIQVILSNLMFTMSQMMNKNSRNEFIWFLNFNFAVWMEHKINMFWCHHQGDERWRLFFYDLLEITQQQQDSCPSRANKEIIAIRFSTFQVLFSFIDHKIWYGNIVVDNNLRHVHVAFNCVWSSQILVTSVLMTRKTFTIHANYFHG